MMKIYELNPPVSSPASDGIKVYIDKSPEMKADVEVEDEGDELEKES